MKTIHHVLCFAFILLISAGCIPVRIDGPYEGRVIDADTNNPIEGAVVSGSWYKEEATPAGSASTYYDSYETLTDKDGKFRIPGRGLLLFTEIRDVDFSIFKAGYEQLEPNPWKGLRTWGIDDSITWQGEKGTFKLRRLSLAEREKRVVHSLSVPINKQRLFRLEYNKESKEIGSDSILPLEWNDES